MFSHLRPTFSLGLLTPQPSKSIKHILRVGPGFLTGLLRQAGYYPHSPSASPGRTQRGWRGAQGRGLRRTGGGTWLQRGEGRGERGARSGAGRGGSARSQSPSSPLPGRGELSGAGEPGGGGGGSGGDGGCRGEGWRGEGGAEPSGDSRGAAERLGRRRGSRCSPRRGPRVGEGRDPAAPGAMGCIGSRTVGGYRSPARVRGKLAPGRSSGPLPHPHPCPWGPPSAPARPCLAPLLSLHPLRSLYPCALAPPGLPSLSAHSLLSIALPQARSFPGSLSTASFAAQSLFPTPDGPIPPPSGHSRLLCCSQSLPEPFFREQPLFSEPPLQPHP